MAAAGFAITFARHAGQIECDVVPAAIGSQRRTPNGASQDPQATYEIGVASSAERMAIASIVRGNQSRLVAGAGTRINSGPQ